MKGIVAEAEKNYVIVITDTGEFIKYKRIKDCKVGDEIVLAPYNFNHIYKRISTAAACIILIAFMFTGVYAYYTPYSYVSMDINPSIGLTVNRFDKVISIKPLNDDARGILEEANNIKNKALSNAVSQILDSASDGGYLKKDSENSVMYVVASHDKALEEKLIQELNSISDSQLKNISNNYNIIIEKTNVKEYKNDIQNEISPGKIILANQLKEVKPEIDIEEARSMSVQQAINMLRENHGYKNGESKDNGNNKAEDSKTKEDNKAEKKGNTGKGNKNNTKEQNQENDKEVKVGNSDTTTNTTSNKDNNGNNDDKGNSNKQNGKVNNSDKSSLKDKNQKNEDSKNGTKGNKGKSNNK